MRNFRKVFRRAFKKRGEEWRNGEVFENQEEEHKNAKEERDFAGSTAINLNGTRRNVILQAFKKFELQFCGFLQV